MKDDTITTLDKLPVGKICVVDSIIDKNNKQLNRMLDFGIVKKTHIKAVNKSPCGDLVAYLIRGSVIAIRKEDAKKILILPSG